VALAETCAAIGYCDIHRDEAALGSRRLSRHGSAADSSLHSSPGLLGFVTPFVGFVVSPTGHSQSRLIHARLCLHRDRTADAAATNAGSQTTSRESPALWRLFPLDGLHALAHNPIKLYSLFHFPACGRAGRAATPPGARL
jgi:hypothetical protein